MFVFLIDFVHIPSASPLGDNSSSELILESAFSWLFTCLGTLICTLSLSLYLYTPLIVSTIVLPVLRISWKRTKPTACTAVKRVCKDVTAGRRAGDTLIHIILRACFSNSISLVRRLTLPDLVNCFGISRAQLNWGHGQTRAEYIGWVGRLWGACAQESQWV